MSGCRWALAVRRRRRPGVHCEKGSGSARHSDGHRRASDTYTDTDESFEPTPIAHLIESTLSLVPCMHVRTASSCCLPLTSNFIYIQLGFFPVIYKYNIISYSLNYNKLYTSVIMILLEKRNKLCNCRAKSLKITW